MVTFKCKRSGNTVSFKSDVDIASMRKEEGYDEVKDETKEDARKDADENANEEKEVIVKKRGRPRKH